MWQRRAPAPAPVSTVRAEPTLPPLARRPPMRIRPEALAGIGQTEIAAEPYRLPEPPPGTLPSGAKMAMDDAASGLYTWAAASQYGGYNQAQLRFPGYAILAELAQQPEYRRGAEVIAEEMTRKWIRLTTGGEDKADRISGIMAALDRYRVQEVFRAATEHDGFFGVGNIHPIINGADPSMPLVLKPAMVKKGSLKAFHIIEPMWCYPAPYNSTNPLAEDFYKPGTWYVQGQKVDASRLMRIVSRPVPTYLKPAYQFGGLSLSMMAQPYIENFKSIRASVATLINSFSVMALGTDMSDFLNTGSSQTAVTRAQAFTQFRDNRGTFVYDKEREEFSNVSAPLGGLDALQGQAEEMICGIQGIPIIKWWGDPPAGLNSSPDGVIRAFYDTIHAKQEKDYREPLRRVLDLIQLSEFGSIDPEITFEFEPLWQMSATESATIQKTRADTDAVYMQEGVVTPEECRQQLISDEASPYHGLTGPAPELPDEDEDEPPLTLSALGVGGEEEEDASSE